MYGGKRRRRRTEGNRWKQASSLERIDPQNRSKLCLSLSLSPVDIDSLFLSCHVSPIRNKTRNISRTKTKRYLNHVLWPLNYSICSLQPLPILPVLCTVQYFMLAVPVHCSTPRLRYSTGLSKGHFLWTQDLKQRSLIV